MSVREPVFAVVEDSLWGLDVPGAVLAEGLFRDLDEAGYRIVKDERLAQDGRDHNNDELSKAFIHGVMHSVNVLAIQASTPCWEEASKMLDAEIVNLKSALYPRYKPEWVEDEEFKALQQG